MWNEAEAMAGDPTDCLTLVEQNIHVTVDSVMSHAGCCDHLGLPQPL